AGAPVSRAGLGAKPGCGVCSPLPCEQQVTGRRGLTTRAIPVPPLACHPDIGLSPPPAASHRARAAVERLCPLCTVLHDPTLDRRVVDGHPALLHEFFDMPITQGIRHILPYT